MKHPLNLCKLLLTVTALCATASCMPTVGPRPIGPVFQGQLVSVQTLAPVEGVEIHFNQVLFTSATAAHQMGREAEIIGRSDATGHFQTTPPISSAPDMLMPGHALSLYRAETWHPDHGTLLLAVYGTMKMRRTELANMGPLFLDSEPDTIAPPSTPDAIAHRELQTYLYPHYILGGCDKQLSSAALAYTNSFRKLHQMPPSDKTRKYTQAARAYAAHLWAATRSSCPATKTNDLNQVFERIFAELGHWSEVVSRPLSATGEEE